MKTDSFHPELSGKRRTIMKKNIRILALVLALLMAAVFMTGCSGNTEKPNQTGNNSGSESGTNPGNNDSNKTLGIRPAVGTGTMTAGDIELAYIESMNAFAAALVRNMGEDWTGVISPVSFAMMLELLANGAGPQEQSEILNALMLNMGIKPTDENAARLIAALNKAFKDITKKDAAEVGKNKSDSKLSLMTAIIVGDGDKFNTVFEGNAADYFNASVGNVDFRDTQKALEVINGWVSENTNGLIPRLFDNIPVDTVMALVNALYFKADWAKPFTGFRGSMGFKGLNGEMMASMLSCTDQFRYGKFDGNQIVLVPYANSSFYMAVVLPAEGTTANEALASSFDLYTRCSEATVELIMPAVQLSTKFDALEYMEGLGLPGLANRDMLFGNIIDDGPVFLTQFVHAAVLNVTEFGTEAAAATGVTGTKNAATITGDVISVICDRPYAMAIVDGNTGAILFASVVNDLPTA